ncbi:unnamed protein product, partial [Allacma fusca]
MGVLAASKPWPMSPPLNPADFPGMNPHPLQTTLVTNFFPDHRMSRPQLQEYVSMRDAAIATALAHQSNNNNSNTNSNSNSSHRGSVFVNNTPQMIPLYETV